MSTESGQAAVPSAETLLRLLTESIAKRVAELLACDRASVTAPAPPRTRYLDLDEAAEYLRLGGSTLRRLQARGDIARVELGGRVLFAIEDLDAFMTRHRHPARHDLKSTRPARHEPAAIEVQHGDRDPFAEYRPRTTSSRNRKGERLPQSPVAGDAKA